MVRRRRFATLSQRSVEQAPGANLHHSQSVHGVVDVTTFVFWLDFGWMLLSIVLQGPKEGHTVQSIFRVETAKREVTFACNWAIECETGIRCRHRTDC